jgi:hypothetical protein
MIETSGAVPIVEPTRALSLLVVVPLAWALASATRRGRSMVVAAISALLTVALAVRTLVLATGAVSRGHAGLVEHVASVARLGSLDLRIDLVADPRAALVTLVAALVGLAVVVSEPRAAREGRARRLGWTGALVAGVALASLGDGFAPVLAGAQLATLATFALAGSGRPRALLVATAGDGGLLLSVCLAFWWLGGSFGPGGWVSDQGSRAALVATPLDETRLEETPLDQTRRQKATLVVTAYGGARVTSDRDVPLPGEPLLAPFVADLDPGVVSFRVSLGPASADVLATNVTLAPRKTYTLVPLGPTASFREIAERTRLAAPEASPDVLAGRMLFGLPLRALLAVLFAASLVARLALVACARAPSPVLALAALLTADLAVRIVSLLGAGGAVLFTVFGALSALGFGAYAASLSRSAPRMRSVHGATVAVVACLALAAAGALEPGAALTLGVVGALGAAAVAGAVAHGAARWTSVAGAVSVGLLPCAGVSAGLVPFLAGTLGDLARGRLAGVAAGVVLGAALLGITLASAAQRWSVDGPGPREPGLEPPAAEGASTSSLLLVPGATLAGALLAVAGGPILGVGTQMFATAAPSLADRAIAATAFWPAARVATDGPHVAVSVLVVVLVTGASALGWVLAGRVVTSPALAAAEVHLGGGSRRIEEGVESAVKLLVRGVVVVEREVLEDAGAMLAALAQRSASRVFAWRAPSDVGAGRLDRVALLVLAKIGLEDPRAMARVRDVAVALGVAIPVLLVLSSWLLG